VYRSVHICTSRIFFNYFAKVFTHVNNKLFPSKSLAKDAISHCGDSIEGKVVTAVDELKEPECGNATEETEKDAEVEKSDYTDEDAISHCGDSIEGKVVTAVDELKEPDCGNATEETEKDAEVKSSDYIDEDTNDMDKLRLSKNRPRTCLNMMQA
jgi:S-ribosylhomocysteine lyase LuxS involved in autoinducer biosynthesis